MTDTDGATVLARAPLRISLAGGGTDLPSYASQHGGLVVGLTINRHVGVTVHPRRFGGGVRACFEDGVECPETAGLLTNRYARAALARRAAGRALQVISFADVPSGKGLGGSGAFTVALLHALRAVDTRADVDPIELAEEASAIEMVDIGRPVGKQDHYLSALGGLHALHIGRDLTVRPEPVAVPVDMEAFVRDQMLLFDTGTSRDAGQILSAQARRTEAGSDATLRALHDIRAMAGDLDIALGEGRFDLLGALLHEHWLRKRSLAPGVSTARLDRLYTLALDAGAEGGKVVGAGGGGFLLLVARRGREDELRKAMHEEHARELSFALEPSGSRVLRM